MDGGRLLAEDEDEGGTEVEEDNERLEEEDAWEADRYAEEIWEAEALILDWDPCRGRPLTVEWDWLTGSREYE